MIKLPNSKWEPAGYKVIDGEMVSTFAHRQWEPGEKQELIKELEEIFPRQVIE